MNTILKIISGIDRYSMSHSELLRIRLLELNISSEIYTGTSEKESLHSNNNEACIQDISNPGSLFNAVLEGEANIALIPLRKIPLQLATGLVICGLSKRDDPSESLLIRSENYMPTSDLNILSGSKVGVTSEIAKMQLLGLHSEIQIQLIEDDLDAGLAMIHDGLLDAVLFSTCELHQIEIDSRYLKIKPLHPREFIPAAGQGTVAYLCHSEDIETRRLFKKIHHIHTSECTNTEREMMKLASLQKKVINVYCENDSNGYYHAFAVSLNQQNNTLKKGRLSQSTTLRLSENLFNLIT